MTYFINNTCNDHSKIALHTRYTLSDLDFYIMTLSELCLKGITLLSYLCGIVTSCSRIFYLYGDITITGEGLKNLGLCSALRAFEQGGIFIVPHLLWHGASVFLVSSEGLPHSVTSYDTQGEMENLFLPRSSRFPISHLLRHTRGCGGPILTRIPTSHLCGISD
jgi:hypothetical protein